MTLVMRYFALACDCDGTIASHGRVDGGTRSAIERLRASGRKLILVTGRELDDFMRVFPHVHLFNRIVAANCAAGTNQGFATCSRWRRRRRWVRAGAGAPRRHALSVGRVIVAHDAITLQCAGIRSCSTVARRSVPPAARRSTFRARGLSVMRRVARLSRAAIVWLNGQRRRVPEDAAVPVP
jgi:hypothetical protein